MPLRSEVVNVESTEAEESLIQGVGVCAGGKGEAPIVPISWVEAGDDGDAVQIWAADVVAYCPEVTEGGWLDGGVRVDDHSGVVHSVRGARYVFSSASRVFLSTVCRFSSAGEGEGDAGDETVSVDDGGSELEAVTAHGSRTRSPYLSQP